MRTNWKSAAALLHRAVELSPAAAEVSARDYGSPGGRYEWQKAHWGVKWGASGVHLCEEADRMEYDIVHTRAKWVHTLQWVRHALVKSGGMDGSRRGVWAITKQGKQADAETEPFQGLLAFRG